MISPRSQMVAKLDRYIARYFVARYLLTFGGVVGLYVVVDAIERIPPISRQPTVAEMARVAADYYISHAPLFLVDLAAGINLIAGLWTLAGLLRHNEFMAIQTSGVSSQRALTAVWAISMAPSALIWGSQEVLAPLLLPIYRDSEWRIRHKSDLATIEAIIVEDNQGRAFCIDVYDPKKRRLEGILVFPSSTHPQLIQAAWGRFVPGGIQLVEVTRWETSTRDRPKIDDAEYGVDTDLSEDVLMRKRQVPQLLDGAALRRLAEVLSGWPQAREFTAEYHRRPADLFSSCGLLLLGIPLFLAASQKGRALGGGGWLTLLFERLLPLLVFAGFYLVRLFAESILAPPWGVWLPALLVLAAGSACYFRRDVF
ncbi:MAG: LptF/LptG family permease [Planctomycetes bacterium]|nr:LptF/LptG family permease [Planctomycetota bacterium]